MSIHAISRAWDTKCKSSTEKLVLIALADHADEANSCWPSVSRLAGRTQLCERAVRNALRSLETDGFVSVKGGSGLGRGNTARYFLNLECADDGEGKGAPRSGKGAPDAGFEPETAPEEKGHVVPKRGTTFLKGAPHAGKGAPRAPKPSRTVKEPSGNPHTRIRARGGDTPPSAVLPEWLPEEAWAEWCTYRTQKCRKTWTQLAAEKCIQTLSKLRDDGHDPIEVIDQAIAAGWTGLFPVKNGKAQQSANRNAWMYDNDDPLFRRPS